MKRRALERHLNACGARKVREGSEHTVWGVGDDDPVRIASVPRHKEIAPGTARSICKKLGVPVPRSVT